MRGLSYSMSEVQSLDTRVDGSHPAVPRALHASSAALRRRRRLVRTLQVGILVVILGLWEGSARLGLIDPFFFSMPTQICERLVQWFTIGTAQGSIWFQIWVTLEEAMGGFLTGAIAGVVAGILLGRHRLAAEVLSIYIKVANAVPRIVLAPIFIMSFGLGMTSKVAVAFVMVFFVVFANAFQGVREADRAIVTNAQILGASPWQVTSTVIIPSAMSWIFASLHVSFGFAIVGAVVGELLGARYGVGQMIAVAQGNFDAAGVFAGMVVLIVVALAAEWAMTVMEARLARWRPVPHADFD
jgi:NitT/TauT family transport system permease protein